MITCFVFLFLADEYSSCCISTHWCLFKFSSRLLELILVWWLLVSTGTFMCFRMTSNMLSVHLFISVNLLKYVRQVQFWSNKMLPFSVLFHTICIPCDWCSIFVHSFLFWKCRSGHSAHLVLAPMVLWQVVNKCTQAPKIVFSWYDNGLWMKVWSIVN